MPEEAIVEAPLPAGLVVVEAPAEVLAVVAGLLVLEPAAGEVVEEPAGVVVAAGVEDPAGVVDEEAPEVVLVGFPTQLVSLPFWMVMVPDWPRAPLLSRTCRKMLVLGAKFAVQDWEVPSSLPKSTRAGAVGWLPGRILKK